jgi:hypothetical protein
MKIRNPWLSAIVAGSACVLCAGAGIAQSDVEERAPELRIYTFGEITMSRYEAVGRLPADSWRTAFWLPTFPNEKQAIAALQTEATKLGADGLLNVSCLDQGRSKWWLSSTEPAFLCYGIAIRVRPGQD